VCTATQGHFTSCPTRRRIASLRAPIPRGSASSRQATPIHTPLPIPTTPQSQIRKSIPLAAILHKLHSIPATDKRALLPGIRRSMAEAVTAISCQVVYADPAGEVHLQLPIYLNAGGACHVSLGEDADSMDREEAGRVLRTFAWAHLHPPARRAGPLCSGPWSGP